MTTPLRLRRMTERPAGGAGCYSPPPRFDAQAILSALAFIEHDDILSWGRATRAAQRVARPRFADELTNVFQGAQSASFLAVGLRRSYGDSCLNSAGRLVDMRGLDRLIAFDPETGVLRADAGISFAEILRFAVPKGWFLPTTPGTRFVTLGGAIANDVHGKNHHGAGAFGRHVRAFGLLRSDRGRLEITAQSDPGLFASTIGGLGLTGIIEWAEVQLVRVGSAYLNVEILPYDNLDAFWTLAEESVERFEHTVAWIDCLARGSKMGRGVFSRANWADDAVYTTHIDSAWRRLPFDAPEFALNSLAVGAFNKLYHRVNRAKAGLRRQHYAPFFYPLDAVRDWNRLYGARGMFQFQCVIPCNRERDAIGALLDVIASSGQASFLAVLKTFGDLRSPGLLSFPRPGTTLALDFPHRGEASLALMARLDAIVSEAGGALYPAKDGRVSREMFRRSFPNWEGFLKDPRMSSDFWRRVAE
jgi:FAD/FMN-containing dehydrogenase